MGTLRKIGRNWQIDTCRNGVRIRKIVGPSKRLALEVLADIEGRMVRGEHGIGRRDALISEIFKRFLDHADARLSPRSVRRYQNVVERFTEFLTSRPRTKRGSHLDPGVIEQFRQERLQSPRPPKTKSMNFEIKALRTIFNCAKQWGLIDRNPTEGVKTQRVTDARPLRFLSDEECRRLLEESPDDMRAIILGFLMTGMRRGELEHLVWDDIDFGARIIRIRHKPDWRPKSHEREIPISPDLEGLLKNLKLQRSSAHEYVFTLEGRPAFDGDIRKRLVRIARRAGVKSLTSIHSLRHTFGSALARSGVALPVVQQLLGHSDVRTTMIYVHTTRDEHRDAVSKIHLSPE